MLGGEGVRLQAVLTPYLWHQRQGWGVFYRLNVNAEALLTIVRSQHHYYSLENINTVVFAAGKCEQKSCYFVLTCFLPEGLGWSMQLRDDTMTPVAHLQLCPEAGILSCRQTSAPQSAQAALTVIDPQSSGLSVPMVTDLHAVMK